ncbi:hypothetical protein KBC70_01330 [Candidatus Woesebacteria bacterium]|jgi:hypothetical protein|nr:hypothetical protein [Candidatus Woesebacteria bacterium]
MPQTEQFETVFDAILEDGSVHEVPLILPDLTNPTLLEACYRLATLGIDEDGTQPAVLVHRSKLFDPERMEFVIFGRSNSTDS